MDPGTNNPLEAAMMGEPKTYSQSCNKMVQKSQRPGTFRCASASTRLNQISGILLHPEEGDSHV